MDASPSAARAALTRILEELDVPLTPAAEVQREVAALLADPGIDDPSLNDLSELPFITIDYDDSRDLDQAMHISRGPGGVGYLVRYALADAAHFVPPGSALFAEALRRGASFYLPGLTVPMLPVELSEGICSLNPEVPRRALVFVIFLDAGGRTVTSQVVRARIRSRAKLTYSGVQRFYDQPSQSPLADKPYSETLELLREVGELRMAEARARDVLQFDRRQAEVLLLDEERGRFGLREEARTAAGRYNEQISLLCNIAGGKLLLAAGVNPQVQPVFRVHDAPPPGALAHLERTIRALCRAHRLDPRVLHWRRRAGRLGPRESLAAYLDRLRASAVDRRLVTAIQRQALITNRRSVYSGEPGRHYALGVRPYSRFSAPMRELVGIFTHKEALEQLGLEQPGATATEDEALREAVIAAANRAKELQRRIDKRVMGLAIDQLFAAEPGGGKPRERVYRATIMGVRPSRLYVRLDDPPVELKVYVADLERQLGTPLRPSEDEVALEGAGVRLVVGSPIDLRCRPFDPKRGRWPLVQA